MLLPGKGLNPVSELPCLDSTHRQAPTQLIKKEILRLVGFSKESGGSDVTLRGNTYTNEGGITQLEQPGPDRVSSQTAQALGWGGTQAWGQS